MLNRRIIALALVIALCAGLCLYFAACGENPVEPVEPKDYVVYFRDGCVNGSYYGYHPATGQIDSFMIPAHALWEMKVSADGKRLYARSDSSIGVVDLQTLKLVTELPYYGNIAFSPDNRLVAIQGYDLYVLNTADFSVFYQDTIRTWNGCFSHDSKKLYTCGGSASDPCVFVVNLEAEPTYTRKQFGDASSMIKVVPSLDESKWFLLRYSGYLYRAFFDVYDVKTDSIIFRDWLIPTAGSMALTPDGKYLFYTAPGMHIDDDFPAESNFRVFDVERNRISMLISTVGFIDGFNPVYMPVGDLAMTPDGQWLIVDEAGCGVSIGAPTFIIFNVNAMTIESYEEVPGVVGMFYTCQNAP